ncbi:MAG: CDP-alcohol phosphatidyltransferase family protein [Myxococcota bacterium]
MRQRERMMDRAERRTALDAYRYEAVCASPLVAFLKRYWFLPVHSVLPAGIHANVITTLGAACNLLSFLCCVAFRAHPNPAWLILAAVLLWTYATFDNIDGTRARQTRTSGPVGELLDHGIDSMTAFLSPLGVAIAFGLPPAYLLAVVCAASIGAHASFWEPYHTGKLTTGYLTDVEGFVVGSLVLAAGGILGVEPITTPMFGTGVSAMEVAVVATVGSFGYQALSCVWRVRSMRKTAQLLPQLGTQALFVAWFVASDGALGVVALCMIVGVSAGRSSLGAIVARLYKTPFPAFDWPTIAVAVVVPFLAFAGETVAALQTQVAWVIAGGVVALYVARLAREARTMAEITGTSVFGLPE